jgi:hypothetical protein
MSRFPLASSFLAVLLLGSPALASSPLLPVSALPGDQLVVVSDTSARAFDRIQSARTALADRHGFDASQELIHARNLLDQAQNESPSLTVQRRIDAVLRQIQDPTAEAPRSVLDGIFAAIDAAGQPEAYYPSRSYVERTRYELYHGNRDNAVRELAAAAARLPYSRLDGPIGTSFELVNRALISLYQGDIESADATLAAAERTTHVVVRVASGLEAELLPDVAAPPPAEEAVLEEALPGDEGDAEAPLATESDIPQAPDFQESIEEAAPAAAAEEAMPAEESAPTGSGETAPAEDAAPAAGEEAPAAEEEAPAEEAPAVAPPADA